MKETNKILNRYKDRCLFSSRRCRFCCFCSCFTCCSYLRGTFVNLRYRVVSVSSPGVTAKKSAHRKVKTPERTMLAEGLKCILRACWSESASRWFERRDADLIEPYQEYERRYGDLFKSRFELAHFLLILQSGDLPFR